VELGTQQGAVSSLVHMGATSHTNMLDVRECFSAHGAHLVVTIPSCSSAEAETVVLCRTYRLPPVCMSKQARRPFVPGSDFSRDGDFVAAYYTEPRRHKLVEAGREWRKVLSLCMSTNDTGWCLLHIDAACHLLLLFHAAAQRKNCRCFVNVRIRGRHGQEAAVQPGAIEHASHVHRARSWQP
jgi:hypothetical protein